MFQADQSILKTENSVILRSPYDYSASLRVPLASCFNKMIEINTVGDYDLLAVDLLKNYADIDVWLFKGEMGAGKTTLIRCILQGAGIQDDVSSPTFSIVNEYADVQGNPVYHMDCYRLSSVNEALQSGIDELITSGNWCLIEWPEVIEKLLWGKVLLITFEKTGDVRKVQIELKAYE